MKVTVVVKCVACKATREIGPGEVEPGEMPFCTCGNVMVAVKAKARR